MLRSQSSRSSSVLFSLIRRFMNQKSPPPSLVSHLPTSGFPSRSFAPTDWLQGNRETEREERGEEEGGREKKGESYTEAELGFMRLSDPRVEGRYKRRFGILSIGGRREAGEKRPSRDRQQVTANIYIWMYETKRENMHMWGQMRDR